MAECPVCHEQTEEHFSDDFERLKTVDCPRCGYFVISEIALKKLGDNWWKLSHWIRKNQNNLRNTVINKIVMQDAIESVIIPKPHEQENIFIKWLGDQLECPADQIEIIPSNIASLICSKDHLGFKYIFDNLFYSCLYCQTSSLDDYNTELYKNLGILVGLSRDGWERYHEITQKGVFSKKAFLAMAYNDRMMNLYNNHFKKAVEKTGFDLLVLAKNLQAGLIDDQLRVQILNSRFLLADLTDGNNGAYWEAGYAEGLGKPVIYLCEKSVFDKKKTHFDTNHLVTVPWDEENIDNAMEKLKATIRLTFPEDAKMTDEN